MFRSGELKKLLAEAGAVAPELPRRRHCRPARPHSRTQRALVERAKFIADATEESAVRSAS